MSYVLGDYVQCETVQRRLEDQFKVCPAMEETPAMDAIISGQAEAKITQEVSDGTGKVKNVKVVYENRLLESAATEGSGARTCVATHETFDNYAMYTIDPEAYVTADEKFKPENLSTVCTEDGRSMLNKKIFKVVDVIERKLATKTSNELVALYGKWAANVANVTNDELVVSTLISAATKQIDDTAMVDINMAIKQTGYCGSKVIVGGSVLYKYWERVNSGCCATTGVNILDTAKKFGKAIAYDERVASALGAEDKSILFQPGSVALLKYNTAPQIPNIGGNYVKMIVYGPRTGVPIDITISDDCGTISIIGYANTKLVALPTDMFAVGDKFRGVNFVNKIKVTNPA